MGCATGVQDSTRQISRSGKLTANNGRTSRARGLARQEQDRRTKKYSQKSIPSVGWSDLQATRVASPRQRRVARVSPSARGSRRTTAAKAAVVHPSQFRFAATVAHALEPNVTAAVAHPLESHLVVGGGGGRTDQSSDLAASARSRESRFSACVPDFVSSGSTTEPDVARDAGPREGGQTVSKMARPRAMESRDARSVPGACGQVSSFQYVK